MTADLPFRKWKIFWWILKRALSVDRFVFVVTKAEYNFRIKYLPPAYVVCGKVIVFSHVCLSVHKVGTHVTTTHVTPLITWTFSNMFTWDPLPYTLWGPPNHMDLKLVHLGPPSLSTWSCSNLFTWEHPSYIYWQGGTSPSTERLSCGLFVATWTRAKGGEWILSTWWVLLTSRILFTPWMLFAPQILVTIGLVSYVKFSCIRHFVHTICLRVRLYASPTDNVWLKSCRSGNF